MFKENRALHKFLRFNGIKACHCIGPCHFPSFLAAINGRLPLGDGERERERERERTKTEGRRERAFSQAFCTATIGCFPTFPKSWVNDECKVEAEPTTYSQPVRVVRKLHRMARIRKMRPFWPAHSYLSSANSGASGVSRANQDLAKGHPRLRALGRLGSTHRVVVALLQLCTPYEDWCQRCPIWTTDSQNHQSHHP
jgi:hypothetical protein